MTLSSKLRSIKKALTLLVGGALVAGSFVAVAPANAAASTAKQPAASAILGNNFNNGSSGRVVVKDGWAYTLQSLTDGFYAGNEVTYLKRTKLSTITTVAPVTLMAQSESDASKSVTTIGGTVTTLYRPMSMDVVGNSIFILDGVSGDEMARRLIQVDLTGLTDSSANLSGTVVATTISGLNSGLQGYGNSRGLAAASESMIFIATQNRVYKITKAGSTWSSDSGTAVTDSVWGLKMAGDGKLVVATSSSMWSPGDWNFRFYSTSDLSTPTATASVPEPAQNTDTRNQEDFAVDPTTNDILFIQGNGKIVQRLVKGSNGSYSESKLEAMGGAEQYTATAIAQGTPFQGNGFFNYEATISGSTSAFQVGANFSFGDYTCANVQGSCYFNSNGEATVTAVSATKVSFKIDSTVNGSGYTSLKLQIVNRLGNITGLTVDSSAGLVVLDRGESYVTESKARLFTFKARTAALGVSSVSVSGGHKTARINFRQPGFTSDIVSESAYLFEGSTSAEALSAATAHANPGTAKCTWGTSDYIYASGYQECTVLEGLTSGKYYAAAIKTVTLDGSEVWNVATSASQVLDSAFTVTLPTDPDPASGNVGPGYAHQGITSVAASDLISSGYKRFKSSDGRGGSYFGFLMGADFKSRVKVVHILNTGAVDSSFGTNGVLDVPGQALTSSEENARSPKLSWYSTGKFVYVDHNDLSNIYNISFEGASQLNSWTLNDATLTTLCASAFPGALSGTTYASNLMPVPAASTDPIIEVGCSAAYSTSANDYQNRTSFNSIPVFAKLTADNTLSLLASSITGVTNYTQAASYQNACVDPYSSDNHIIAEAAPEAGDPLFTALLIQYPANSGWCNSNGSGRVSTSMQIKADGTVTKTTNNLPTSNYPSIQGIWPTSSGKTYLEMTQNMDSKLYRLTSSAVLDTTFGSSGSLTISAPGCAGSYRAATGISESNSGEVYFNGVSWMNQMGGQQSSTNSVYPFAVLLEKASNNSADVGTSYLGATLGYNSTPQFFTDGYWSSIGTPFSTSVIATDGSVSLAYYAGAAGLKTIKIDSFSSALPAGEDYLACPPSPFETVVAGAPFYTENTSIVQLTNGSIFAYNTATSGADTGKATIFTPGANSNLKSGTFAVTEASNTVHAMGWAVALADNKVMVGGGVTATYMPNRTIEIYDPAAAAGSRWTTLTGTAGATNLLVDKTRRGATAQLLANGKVLVFGGYESASYNDGELVTIGATNASTVTVAFADAGSPFVNIIPAGAGKWLLFGTSDRIMPPAVATSATKIYTESTGLLTAGPALGSGRVTPAVVNLGGTKTLIAGDNTMRMGPDSPVGGQQSYDIYDSSNNTITTKTLTPGMNGYFSVGFGALLPSGKVLLIQTQMTMNPAQAKVLDLATSTQTDGELMPNGLRSTKLFKVGDKVLLAGGRNAMGGGMTVPGWQVFTEPVAVVGSLTVDARKVLKGTTGNMVVTAGVPMTIGAGATALTVQYANGAGSNVLKASPTPLVSGAAKLKLDATGRILTAPLPAVAQLNAAGVGTVIATIKQGTTSLGTVTITYVAVKDTPVFTSDVPPTIPGMVSSFPFGATTNAGNGVPALTYKSGTTKVCTVTANGTVTRVARGLCKITVSQAADLGTLAKAQEYSFTFAKSTAVLTFAAGTPAAGNIDLTEDDIQLNVGATVDNAPAADLDLTYSVDNDDKCSIDEEGVLNTLAVGACLVTVTYAGDANVSGPVTITRQYNIVTPTQENPGSVGGVIGDAIYEEKDDPEDTMLTVSMSTPKHVKRTIKLGRGWKIVYTPTIKAKTTNVVTGANFQPTMTAAYIGTMTTTFIVAKTAFAKTPAGWKVVGTNYTCAMTYGSKTQVAANKKIKTVTQKPAKAGCALPALTASVQVKVKNNWTRLGQKKGSPVLTAQKRTAKINLQ